MTTWYYRPWGVLVLLFFVLGPLGLSLLWRSPSFTRGWKIVLMALTVYTVLLVDSMVVAVRVAMEQLELTQPR